MFDCHTTYFGNPGVMVLDLQKLLDKLLVNHFCDAGVMALDLQKIYLVISLSGSNFDTLWLNVSSFFHKW